MEWLKLRKEFNFNVFLVVIFWVLGLKSITFYTLFLSFKFLRNPLRMLAQLQNLWTGRFQTKMEMTPIRGLKYLFLAKKLSKGDK